MTNVSLSIKKHTVLVLVVLMEDVVVAAEVATVDEAVKAVEADVAVTVVKEMDLDTVEENSPSKCEQSCAPHCWKGVHSMQEVRLECRLHRPHHQRLCIVREEGVPQ